MPKLLKNQKISFSSSCLSRTSTAPGLRCTASRRVTVNPVMTIATSILATGRRTERKGSLVETKKAREDGGGRGTAASRRASDAA